MIVLGGLVLQACVLGALLRPEKGLVRKAKIQKYLIENFILTSIFLYLIIF